MEVPPETLPVRVDIIAPPTARLAEPERVVEWVEYGASEQGTPALVSMVTDGNGDLFQMVTTFGSQIPESNFFQLGHLEFYALNKGQQFLFKLDGSDGSVLWHQELPCNVVEWEDDAEFAFCANHYWVTATQNGDAMVVGQSYNSERERRDWYLEDMAYAESIDHAHAMVARFDGTDGAELWRHHMLGRIEFSAGAVDKDDNIIVGGIYFPPVSFDGSPLDTNAPMERVSLSVVAKYSGDTGEYIWSKPIANATNPAEATDVISMGIDDVRTGPDGGIYICGPFSETMDFGIAELQPMVNAENMDVDVYVTRLESSDGASTWVRQFGRNQWEACLGLSIYPHKSQPLMMAYQSRWMANTEGLGLPVLVDDEGDEFNSNFRSEDYQMLLTLEPGSGEIMSYTAIEDTAFSRLATRLGYGWGSPSRNIAIDNENGHVAFTIGGLRSDGRQAGDTHSIGDFEFIWESDYGGISLLLAMDTAHQSVAAWGTWTDYSSCGLGRGARIFSQEFTDSGELIVSGICYCKTEFAGEIICDPEDNYFDNASFNELNRAFVLKLDYQRAIELYQASEN